LDIFNLKHNFFYHRTQAVLYPIDQNKITLLVDQTTPGGSDNRNFSLMFGTYMARFVLSNFEPWTWAQPFLRNVGFQSPSVAASYFIRTEFSNSL